MLAMQSLQKEINIDNPAVTIDEIKNEDNLNDNNFEENEIENSSKSQIDKSIESYF